MGSMRSSSRSSGSFQIENARLIDQSDCRDRDEEPLIPTLTGERNRESIHTNSKTHFTLKEYKRERGRNTKNIKNGQKLIEREMNSEVSEDDLQQSYDWDRKTGFLSSRREFGKKLRKNKM